MTTLPLTVLVVGATGNIGRLVVEEAIRRGHAVCALVRDPAKARRLPAQVQVVGGDVTQPETLPGAADGIDAIVFTLGSTARARQERTASIMVACATFCGRSVLGRRASR